MREIKFRAWDKKEKVMSLGDILNIFFKPYTCQFGFMKDGKINVVVRCIEDVELMQYTGLKDINGKEIYDGDIVKTNIDLIGVVSFDLGYYLDWIKEDKILMFNKDIKVWCNDWGLEVIGNIYENPELLGE